MLSSRPRLSRFCGFRVVRGYRISRLLPKYHSASVFQLNVSTSPSPSLQRRGIAQYVRTLIWIIQNLGFWTEESYRMGIAHRKVQTKEGGSIQVGVSCIRSPGSCSFRMDPRLPMSGMTEREWRARTPAGIPEVDFWIIRNGRESKRRNFIYSEWQS